MLQKGCFERRCRSSTCSSEMEEVEHGGTDSEEQVDERGCLLKSPVLTGDGVNGSASDDPTESEKSTVEIQTPLFYFRDNPEIKSIG